MGTSFRYQPGMTKGLYTLIEPVRKNNRAYWLARCECGAEHLILPGNKKDGFACKSCAKVKHGYYGSPTYRSWECMKARCNGTAANSKYWAGKGTTYDPRWEKFEDFLADMGERPEGKTLDRIDNHGNYEPGNCRWATPKEQANNRG